MNASSEDAYATFWHVMLYTIDDEAIAFSALRSLRAASSSSLDGHRADLVMSG